MATKAPAKETTKTASAPAKSTAVPTKATTPAVKSKPVPETILKKRRSRDYIAALDLKKRTLLRRKASTKRRLIIKKAEDYAREYRAQERSLIRFKRTARSGGNYYIEPEAKFAFVIRIRGILGLHPKPRKVLQLLRLRQIHNGVFLRLNRATLNMLKLVEPYVTYGYPNLKTVHDLIYKRGFGRVNHQRRGITDNALIEKTLGEHGMVCIEDLVHEIYTVGPKFKQVNKFFWPFKLNSPRGGFQNVKTHFNEGGDAGNREKEINELVRRML